MAERELKISFTTTIIPKKEHDQQTAAASATLKRDAFGTQELSIGGEDFVVVFGRTHVTTG